MSSNPLGDAHKKPGFKPGFCLYGVPKGIRTPVTAVKGLCPRPLDDGDVPLSIKGVLRTPFYPELGGASRDRTGDLLHAMQALSQLSYSPKPRRRHFPRTEPCCQGNSP